MYPFILGTFFRGRSALLLGNFTIFKKLPVFSSPAQDGSRLSTFSPTIVTVFFLLLLFSPASQSEVLGLKACDTTTRHRLSLNLNFT